jgi:hypothetical protein
MPINLVGHNKRKRRRKKKQKRICEHKGKELTTQHVSLPQNMNS